MLTVCLTRPDGDVVEGEAGLAVSGRRSYRPDGHPGDAVRNVGHKAVPAARSPRHLERSFLQVLRDDRHVQEDVCGTGLHVEQLQAGVPVSAVGRDQAGHGPGMGHSGGPQPVVVTLN